MKKNTFSNSVGFILAAASSAIGLGNIWRFPYLAAKYGGGIFLLIYIILVVTFGFTLMITENAIGRKTGLGPLCAFSKINKKFGFIGVLAFIVPCIIMPYYNVIGGWIIKYFVMFISNNASVSGDEFFGNMLANSPGELIGYQFLFTAFTTLIIVGGVQKGIERASRILMPLLLILSVAVAVYSCTLPGATEGIKYFFIPKFENFSLNSILAALGQMFYSLSLAMGIMISYGSYLPKEANLEKSVGRIEIFDTAIAILAGLMIIPAVFAFSGGNPDTLNAGPKLMFITLPKVFYSMGHARAIGSVFFILVFFAAITSSLSIMEAIVSSVMDKFGISRTKTSIIIGLLVFLVGTFVSLGYNILDFITIAEMTILDIFDFVSNSVIMPITALATCIFIGWFAGVNTISDEVELSGEFRRKKLYTVMVKYIAPIFTVLILISSVLSTFGIISL